MTDSDAPIECPLCMEEMDATDRNFKPCKCGYQVCLWCWRDIKQKSQGKCPNCRAPYQDDNIQFTAPDPALIQKQLLAGKQKKKTTRAPSKVAPPSINSDRSHLQDVRVLQRNLVYVVGLPPSHAKEEMLKRKDWFGRFGKIIKIAVNRKQVTNAGDPSRASYSAYVTFKRSKDAADSIKAIHGAQMDGRTIRATYGTTKYCSFFMRHLPCNNPNCLYLHEMARPEDCYTKEDLNGPEPIGQPDSPGIQTASSPHARPLDIDIEDDEGADDSKGPSEWHDSSSGAPRRSPSFSDTFSQSDIESGVDRASPNDSRPLIRGESGLSQADEPLYRQPSFPLISPHDTLGTSFFSGSPILSLAPTIVNTPASTSSHSAVGRARAVGPPPGVAIRPPGFGSALPPIGAPPRKSPTFMDASSFSFGGLSSSSHSTWLSYGQQVDNSRWAMSKFLPGIEDPVKQPVTLSAQDDVMKIVNGSLPAPTIESSIGRSRYAFASDADAENSGDNDFSRLSATFATSLATTAKPGADLADLKSILPHAKVSFGSSGATSNPFGTLAGFSADFSAQSSGSSRLALWAPSAASDSPAKPPVNAASAPVPSFDHSAPRQVFHDPAIVDFGAPDDGRSLGVSFGVIQNHNNQRPSAHLFPPLAQQSGSSVPSLIGLTPTATKTRTAPPGFSSDTDSSVLDSNTQDSTDVSNSSQAAQADATAPASAPKKAVLQLDAQRAIPPQPLKQNANSSNARQNGRTARQPQRNAQGVRTPLVTV